MSPNARIIVNTLVQYVKAFITTFLALYSTRIVLSALTDSDYGLYQLIAGVVAMLGFITNSLIITTQRYISFFHGKGNIDNVRKLYQNSSVLHWLIAGCIALILLALEPWLVYDVLNISFERLQVASYLYFIMVFILFITIISAPLKALFIARESMTFIAIVEILDALLKLLLAFFLLSMEGDRLLFYGVILGIIQILNFILFGSFALWRFPECTLWVRLSDISWNYIRQFLGFAGWTTYGAGAVTLRAQGIAVLLNHFFGTVINAAYGIATQVYMGLTIISTSIFNAMNPQIMKAEGEGNRKKMLWMAEKESKYSVAMMSIVSVPIMFEMKYILFLWLDDVPEYTALFCRFILLAFLCDLLTYGLNTANQAIGRLRVYTLVMYTPKLLTLLLAWFMLKYTGSVIGVMGIYVLIEFLMSMFRLFYMKYYYQLNIGKYFQTVLLPTIWLLLALVLTSACCSYLPIGLFRTLFTIVACSIVGLTVFWYCSMDDGEHQYVLDVIRKIKRK